MTKEEEDAIVKELAEAKCIVDSIYWSTVNVYNWSDEQHKAHTEEHLRAQLRYARAQKAFNYLKETL